MKLYIGVDPGQKGGLAFIGDGAPIEYDPMPDTVRGIYDWIDFADCFRLSKEEEIVMVVELAQVMPGQGAVAGFTYGRHFGVFEAIATALDIPYHEVRPNIWKRSLGLPTEKDKKNAKINSIMMCQRLFPEVKLILPGCRKAHDGLAEALLIAEYGRRKNL